MPNGGSDCCGTCWFNENNKGETGHAHARDPGRAFCVIRDLEIEDPFYTYCINHPHRSPNKLATPLGPVYTGDDSGDRTVWKEAPDTESIRLALLGLVATIRETPSEEYPLGSYRDDVAIWQLGELGEARAVEQLQRIAAFDPTVRSQGPIERSRHSTVEAAREALRKIGAAGS